MLTQTVSLLALFPAQGTNMAVLTAPYYGQNTNIDQTAIQLIGDNTAHVNYGTVIKALPGNAGIIYIGLNDDVTTSTGWPLSAGQEMNVSPAEVNNAGSIYIIASADNQGAAFRIV